MSIARRQMVQALAGLPFIGRAIEGSAKANLAQALTSIPMGGLNQAAGNCTSAPTPANPAMKWLYDARQEFEQYQSFKSQTRLNGLDADLASMRSLSPGYRALKQRERLHDDENLMNRWRIVMNW